MSWKEKVLALMKERSINQKELSKMIGITESSLSRYLHNDRWPRMDTIVNVARALNVETGYLLDEEDKSDTAFNCIATAIAEKVKELTAEEKTRLIRLILGSEN